MMNASDFRDDNMEISTTNFQTSYHFLSLNLMFSHVGYFWYEI